MIDLIDEKYFLMTTPAQELGVVKSDDISRACPVCREGKSLGRAKRMHLYTKSSYEGSAISCFNCGYSTNMYVYLMENYPEEYVLYKQEKKSSSFNELILSKPKKNVELPDMSNVANISLDFGTETYDIEAPEVSVETPETPEVGASISLDFGEAVLPMEDLDVAFEEDKYKPSNLKDISILSSQAVPLLDSQKAVDCRNYLTGRGVMPRKEWLYVENSKIQFNSNDIYIQDYIIIPLMFEDKIYGFQALAWKEKKFFVYLLEGNTSWKVWNWNNIDKSKTVYIFESIYDAISSGFENCIAQLGANIHEDRLTELEKPVFCLDNQNVDAKSAEESLKYLKKGYKVFLWPSKVPNKIKDANDLVRNGVSEEKIQKLIDVNTYQGMKGIIKCQLEY